MSDIVISAEGLGKEYTIGHKSVDNGPYVALRDVVAQNARRLWDTTRDLMRGRPIIQGDSVEEVWALKNVSFDVKQGEVVGVIGRNGAGKSTLLKILSRITEPTEGRVRIRGRVASLLEIGTGFHPELTGRENIFLNGAVLGMTRAEVKNKFDEIVSFAEVEKFIDTPVKRYSSGMYLRLAFAVAANLETDILLVDEVLAVGDARFQKKCLGKLGEVKENGRTVLFVSHNIAAILSLCARTIVLNLGTVIYDGAQHGGISQYARLTGDPPQSRLSDRSDRFGNQVVQFTALSVCDANYSPLCDARSGEEVNLVLSYVAKHRVRGVHVSIGLYGRFNEKLTHLSNRVTGCDFQELPEVGELICTIPSLPLMPGRFSLNLNCTVGGEIADSVQNAGFLDVELGDFYESGKMPATRDGVFVIRHSWKAKEGLRSRQSVDESPVVSQPFKCI